MLGYHFSILDVCFFFFFSSRRRHTRLQGDWSSDVCSSDLAWIARDAGRDPESPSSWRRIPVGRGVELHVETAHPLARLGPDETAVAEAVRQAIAKLLPHAGA